VRSGGQSRPQNSSDRGVRWSDESDVLERELHDLLLLELVRLLDLGQHGFLRSLLHLSAEHQLVEDEVGLLEVEDDVELADGSEVLVQHLHVPVDNFQHVELVIGSVHPEAEEEAGVPLVDHLQVPVLDEVAHLGLPQQDGRGELPAHLFLLLGLLGLVPLLEAQLALPAEEDHEVDHRGGGEGGGGSSGWSGGGDGVGGGEG